MQKVQHASLMLRTKQRARQMPLMLKVSSAALSMVSGRLQARRAWCSLSTVPPRLTSSRSACAAWRPTASGSAASSRPCTRPATAHRYGSGQACILFNNMHRTRSEEDSAS